MYIVYVILLATLTEQLSLKPGSFVEITLTNNPKVLQEITTTVFDSNYVSIQVHSQARSVIASYSSSPLYGCMHNSTDAGIVVMRRRSQSLMKAYVGTDSKLPVQSLVFVLANKYRSPVPGACCLTCAMEIDPNIQISYNFYHTTVQFSRANQYTLKSCDDSQSAETFQLSYGVYYYYLAYNDFSRQALFEGITNMSTVEGIKSHGTLLKTIQNKEKLLFKIETLTGQGVIFNVIVTDPDSNTASSYIPTHTYGCHFNETDNSECKSRAPIYVLITIIIGACAGFILCFVGYRLFEFSLFSCGTLLCWAVIYTIMTNAIKNAHFEELFVISLFISLIGGALSICMYSFKKLIYLAVLLISLTLGCFLSAIIFYTPFGYLKTWDTTLTFGIAYLCFSLLLTLIALFFPRQCIYISTSIVGSYAMILVPNYYFRSNLQFIITTVILRLTVPNFGTSFLHRPFQTIDLILSGVWAVLFILGCIIQYYTTKNRDFKISGKQMRQKAWDRFSESIQRPKKRSSRRVAAVNERTRLIPEPSVRVRDQPIENDEIHTAQIHSCSNLSYGTSQQPSNLMSFGTPEAPSNVNYDTNEQQPPPINPYWAVSNITSFRPAPATSFEPPPPYVATA